MFSGLDNLPNEVQHLLQEIKIKDQQCQGKYLSHKYKILFFTGGMTEIQRNIAKDQSKYIKSSLKQSSHLPTNSTGSGDQSANGSPTSNDSNSKAHLPGRISVAYAEIEALTTEKISIARQIIELLSRTRARLDGDLSKVRILQGEPPDDFRPSVSPNVAHQLTLSSPYGTKRYVGNDTAVIGVSPIIQIGDSLRTAAGVGKSDTIHSMPPSGPGYNKSKSLSFSSFQCKESARVIRVRVAWQAVRVLTPVPLVLYLLKFLTAYFLKFKERRLTTTTSIKLPSPAPMPTAHQTATSTRSRLSRQSHAVRAQQHEEEDLDADADGDEEVEGDDAEDDLTLYCFCNKQSYGDVSRTSLLTGMFHIQPTAD